MSKSSQNTFLREGRCMSVEATPVKSIEFALSRNQFAKWATQQAAGHSDTCLLQVAPCLLTPNCVPNKWPQQYFASRETVNFCHCFVNIIVIVTNFCRNVTTKHLPYKHQANCCSNLSPLRVTATGRQVCLSLNKRFITRTL